MKNSFSATIFGDKLKLLRKQKNLSQNDLAITLGISQNSLSRYENGERIMDVEKLAELCSVFEISADYMLGFQSIPLLSESSLNVPHNLSLEQKKLLRNTLAHIGLFDLE